MSYDKDWEVYLALNDPNDPIHDYIEAAMQQTEPQFKVGDRVWSHYTYKWGTVERIVSTDRDRYRHGIETPENRMDDTTWYDVRADDGSIDMLDDAHGNWDMARIVPPHIARRYGYGEDPQAAT